MLISFYLKYKIKFNTIDPTTANPKTFIRSRILLSSMDNPIIKNINTRPNTLKIVMYKLLDALIFNSDIILHALPTYRYNMSIQQLVLVF